MLHVGLTGGIGSGKTTVARVFSLLGVPVFEADAVGKALLDEDPDLRRAVQERFGPELYASGALDRKALANLVFNDPTELAALNALVHPAVRKAFHTWAEQQKESYVIMEAAILAETGGHAALDRIVVVSAPEEQRIQRVMRRDGVSHDAVQARIRNQASEQERLAIAQHVVVNDDTQLVIPQVMKVHRALFQAAMP